ncbi:CDC6, C-terminal domain-containing protein, partial [Cynara cardunculus var. scolymus]
MKENGPAVACLCNPFLTENGGNTYNFPLLSSPLFPPIAVSNSSCFFPAASLASATPPSSPIVVASLLLHRGGFLLNFNLLAAIEMPSIAGNRSSPMSIAGSDVSSPQKRRLRSNSALLDDLVSSIPSNPCSPLKNKSPRRCMADSPNRSQANVSFLDRVFILCHSVNPNSIFLSKHHLQGNETVASNNVTKMTKSPKKKLLDSFLDKPIWNPTDLEQLSAVKEALHVSTSPSMIVCREDEQKRIAEFCKQCLEQEKAGSLYICGCPGTGKSLSMENVKGSLAVWAKETGGQLPEILTISCPSLSSTSEIFNKVKIYYDNDVDKHRIICSQYNAQKLVPLADTWKESTTKETQWSFYTLKAASAIVFQKAAVTWHENDLEPQRLIIVKLLTRVVSRLVIADELDYLITKDRVVLHDLFMLTTLPFSKVILIGMMCHIVFELNSFCICYKFLILHVSLTGIANAIDLADRFLPKLQSLNCECKPMVVSFRAYSMEQIIIILKQRLMALPYAVFQPQALELNARQFDVLLGYKAHTVLIWQKVAAASGDMRKALGICRGAIEMLETELRESACTSNLSAMVRVDHMAIALSRAYKSPIVDTIQSLPQHQQIILCSAVKLFRRGKKDTTIGELNKSYIDVCKSTLIPPVGIMELSCMCRVLGDQGILKLGQSRDDKLRRVTLQ